MTTEIDKVKESILFLSQDGNFHVDFGPFSVTLGDNGLYYLGFGDVECIDNCVGKCHCARMYPNSFSFITPIEVVNFVALNFFNHQAEYRTIKC